MSIRDCLSLGKRPVIGMVHSLPLPGTARYHGAMSQIASQAVNDALTLERAGVDAVMVENMGDDPFAVELDHAQITALATVATLVRQAVTIPVGVDAAINDYKTAISIAHAVGGDFVRLPVFVDTVEFYGCGIVYPCARNAMNYRHALRADDVAILADIQVKHTHMLIPSIPIEDSARAARDCGADALIVTGSRIGNETPLEMIERVKAVVDIPVFAGSGVNEANISEQLRIADGAIIGSSLKDGGDVSAPISFDRTRALVAALERNM